MITQLPLSSELGSFIYLKNVKLAELDRQWRRRSRKSNPTLKKSPKAIVATDTSRKTSLQRFLLETI